MSFFKIGVDLNGMSASEYLPLYQSFTNRTHIKKWHWFDQSKIAQIIDANKCCLEMYGRYVNSSIAYILVSVCPADGITSCCPIWVDTIKNEFQSECIVLSYNIRPSAWWTPFDDWILGCQKEVAFHAPLQHGSRRRFQFEIPLKTYRDGLCCACDRRQISITPRRL